VASQLEPPRDIHGPDTGNPEKAQRADMGGWGETEAETDAVQGTQRRDDEENGTADLALDGIGAKATIDELYEVSAERE